MKYVIFKIGEAPDVIYYPVVFPEQMEFSVFTDSATKLVYSAGYVYQGQGGGIALPSVPHDAPVKSGNHDRDILTALFADSPTYKFHKRT